MRSVILLFTATGFVIGTLFGFTGHFLLSRGETRPAEAMPLRTVQMPTVLYRGVEGAAPSVAATIDGAVRARLAERGIRLTDHADACAIRLGAAFSHEAAGDAAQVSIVWLLHAATGREIAQVQMHNAVPLARLAGDWSGDAPHIARSVADSVERIFAEVPPVC